MKRRRLMGVKDETVVFDDEWIKKLIDIAEPSELDARRFTEFLSDGIVKAPPGFNLPCLKEGILNAVRIFAKEPTRREMRADIREMHRLAAAAIDAEDHAVEGHRNVWTDVDKAYDRLARLLITVSPQVCDYLEESMAGWRRLSRPEQRPDARETRERIPFHVQNRAPALPSPNTLRNPSLRRQSCIDVWTICSRGVVPDHSSGKVNWGKVTFLLNVPPPQRMDRDPERFLVFRMHMAWLNSWPLVGRQPSWTAHHEKQNPFVKLTNQILRLVGARHASAVSLLNELHQIRKSAKSWQFDEKKEKLKRRIRRAIRETGAKSQTDISRLISHPAKGLIAAALSELQDQGKIRLTEIKKTGGRARRIWSS